MDTKQTGFRAAYKAVSEQLNKKKSIFGRSKLQATVAQETADFLIQGATALASNALPPAEKQDLLRLASRVLLEPTENSQPLLSSIRSMLAGPTTRLYAEAMKNLANQPEVQLKTFGTLVAQPSAAGASLAATATGSGQPVAPTALGQADLGQAKSMVLKKFDKQQLAVFKRVVKNFQKDFPEIKSFLESDKIKEVASLTIDDKTFFLGNLLAAGGFGAVYMGLAPGNFLVAVKLIKFNYSGLAEIREEVENLKAAKAATQPIAWAVNRDEAGKPVSAFIVMAFAQGNLCDLFDRMPKERVPDALMLTMQSVAKTMQELTRIKKMHRDIKPANILYDHKGEIKLADMGLVSKLDDNMKFDGGAIACTPSFMPIESFQGKFDGVSSDIWSLGVSIVNLLVGDNVISPYRKEGDIRTNVVANLMMYKMWHDGLPTSKGSRLDMVLKRMVTASQQPVAHPQLPLDAAYVKAATVLTAEGAHFLFFYLLHPDPKKRRSWDDVRKASENLLKKAGPEGPLLLKNYIEGAARVQPPKTRAALVQLQAYQAVHQAADTLPQKK
jgi:hypothetical protein